MERPEMKCLKQPLTVFGLLLFAALSIGTLAGAPVAADGNAGASPGAAEYVYLHQTRNGSSALQKMSDRSRLQCAAN